MSKQDFDSVYASLMEKCAIAKQNWKEKEAVTLRYRQEEEKAFDAYEEIRQTAEALMEDEAKALNRILSRGYTLAPIKLVSQDKNICRDMESRLGVIAHYDNKFSPCFIIVDGNRLMENQAGFGRYYTAAQVRIVAKLFKDAIAREDEIFTFPTVEELNKA